MNPRDNAPGTWPTHQQFASAQRNGKKVEALFAELKNLIGLRRLRLRRMKFVREQFFLAAAAQNLKRSRDKNSGRGELSFEGYVRLAPLGLSDHHCDILRRTNLAGRR